MPRGRVPRTRSKRDIHTSYDFFRSLFSELQDQEQEQREQQHLKSPDAAHQQASPLIQEQRPGLFAQMVSTMTGVVVGHTIENNISSLFGSGNTNEPLPQQQEQQPIVDQAQNSRSCEADAKAFTECLKSTDSDMSACKWYFDALKQCQQMASQY